LATCPVGQALLVAPAGGLTHWPFAFCTIPVAQLPAIPADGVTHVPPCIVCPVAQVVVDEPVHPPVPLDTWPVEHALVTAPAGGLTHWPFAFCTIPVAQVPVGEPVHPPVPLATCPVGQALLVAPAGGLTHWPFAFFVLPAAQAPVDDPVHPPVPLATCPVGHAPPVAPAGGLTHWPFGFCVIPVGQLPCAPAIRGDAASLDRMATIASRATTALDRFIVPLSVRVNVHQTTECVSADLRPIGAGLAFAANRMANKTTSPSAVSLR
jgi:hypothetical protein